MPLFESYDRRITHITKVLNSHGISSIEEAKKLCLLTYYSLDDIPPNQSCEKPTLKSPTRPSR